MFTYRYKHVLGTGIKFYEMREQNKYAANKLVDQHNVIFFTFNNINFKIIIQLYNDGRACLTPTLPPTHITHPLHTHTYTQAA